MTAEADRVACCVPFCRRTRRREDDDGPDVEQICWPHWKRIPLRERKVYARAYYDARPDKEADLKRPARWLTGRRKRELRGIVLRYRRCDRLWARMKRRAVECADLGSFA